MDQKPSYFQFKSGEASGEALLRWFHHIHNTDGDAKRGRADRAHLRRANTPDDILFVEAFHRFMRINLLPESLKTEHNWIAMAMIAGALAHCKREADSDDSFAQQLARPQEKGGKAPVSELRFAQLQKSRDYEEFYRRLLRVIRLVGGNVNVLSLANSILHWHREHRFGVDRIPTKRLAVNWARDYFDAAPAESN